MKCMNRGTDLLMLAHGEATGISKLRIHLHLLWCGRCRTRLGEFDAVSKSLALKLENPSIGVRPIIGSPGLGRVGITLAMATILVLVIGFLAIRKLNSAEQDNCVPAIHSAGKHPVHLVHKVSPDSNFPRHSCDK